MLICQYNSSFDGADKAKSKVDYRTYAHKHITRTDMKDHTVVRMRTVMAIPRGGCKRVSTLP